MVSRSLAPSGKRYEVVASQPSSQAPQSRLVSPARAPPGPPPSASKAPIVALPRHHAVGCLQWPIYRLGEASDPCAACRAGVGRMSQAMASGSALAKSRARWCLKPSRLAAADCVPLESRSRPNRAQGEAAQSHQALPNAAVHDLSARYPLRLAGWAAWPCGGADLAALMMCGCMAEGRSSLYPSVSV